MSTRRPRWELTLLAYLAAGIMFFPIFWLFLTGFKSEAEAMAIPPRLFFSPTLESLYEAVTRSDYGRHFLNSIISALGSTLLALLLAVPAAYAMAFYPTPRTPGTLLWMISTKMMPPVGVIIPVYLIFRDLRWLDNVWALALIYAVMNLPVVVWTLYAYFREVPHEIMEAARVDGASTAQEMLRVLLPVSGPAIASAALLSIILAWNESFWSLNLTAAQASPLSVYVASFKTAEGLFWAKMSAASMIAILPVIVMGWLAQRQLVRGLTFGAIK
ncbi:carbohydrate ABC transporter permease [Meiothermus sp. QL-1]|uniref:carbohydrate ABC transporter permease n=1 Tax=Meiothermus sp. QL-1 TaxID=2058095 RepID=UPI000E0AFD43|nr:carbohydrate ABC transporter permease [Meiothermus sp. QL-1]RDI96410.1 carbohydrate ABC transporter permease [Meiothermus sp. QL-1]